MTLTEKWKKGELEQGWYYVQLIRGEYRIDLYIKDKNEWIDCPDAIIDAVVCAVPSYEELQELKAQLAEHKEYCCCAKNEVLVLENARLKDLLKECKPLFFSYVKDMPISRDKTLNLLARINSAIGESEE